MSKILVLGARGKTGRRVAARLRELGVPHRPASRAGDVPFDWNDPGTWDAALDDVHGVYLVRPELHPDDLLRAFTARAVTRGAERLVLLSARAGGPGLDRPRERIVQQSGAAWTVLRPTWYFQNFSEGMFAGAVRSGELRLPAGAGREAFVDAGDVAEAAVAALTGDGHHEQVYELSGPQPLSLAEVVAAISEGSGLAVRYRPVTPGAYVSELTAAGRSGPFAELQARLLTWVSQDEGAHVSDGVERALSRPPRPFAAFVKQAAAEGAWA
ncbi:SDR family NAD(P)-dependent oxidoreductase [Nonomuraea sp. NPDC050202]|uniref:SDR family NAD(P)-dependent oxidoreductase n=1 Tax=Nonomuraea sp. NPDC050202 TaxID=3155035 RepID=UPI0033D627B2